MNILIVKTSAIGDVLHTLPALACLRRQYPSAHIAWLVEEAASQIVVGHPLLDRVLISRRKRWIKDFLAGNWRQALKEFFAFVQEIRKVKYDLLIDFQGLLKSSLFIACCRATRKVGFGRGMEHAEGSYLFLNERIQPVDMDIHAVDRELMLLKEIGIEVSADIGYSLPVDHQIATQAKEMLDRRGVDLTKPLIAINPMTTWPTKHWAEEGFSQVAEELLKDGTAVVFTGGKGDRKAVDRICASIGGKEPTNIAGETDLKLLAAVYSLAKLVISTDTGPMHLAAAVGTPVLALFGPTSPWRTGPYGDGHQVIRTGIGCNPCFKKSCRFGTTQCMKAISVNEVVGAAKQMLTKGGKAVENCT